MSTIEWSPWRKWWMDVVKWFLVTGAGFGLTFGVFSHLEENRSEHRALCASRIDGVRRALVQFDSAASAYRAAANDAFIELYRWRTEQPTEPIRSWWTAYPSIDAALRSVESAYPAVFQETEYFRDQMDGFFDIVRNELINPRLDDIEKIYATGIDPTEEQRRQALKPISREELERRKPELMGLLKEMDKAQKSAASMVAAALSKPANTFCTQAK